MGSLVIVSNRLPVTVSLTGDRVELTPSAGGLATAMSGVRGLDYQWIGWPGTEIPEPLRNRVDESLRSGHHCVPLYLTAEQVDLFYNRFSNGVLWPLFHYLTDFSNFDSEGWTLYQEVNERYAEAAAEHADLDGMVWVHDYHLMLVPRLLRQRRPDLRIGFFLHIPFPSSEVYRVLPVRGEILEGMLGADVIGFHTYGYLRHFSSACLRVLGVDSQPGVVELGDRQIRLSVNPIGIDVEHLLDLANEPVTCADLASLREEFSGKRVILGVDRMDYSKGLRHKLNGYHRFLERYPELGSNCLLLQVAVPSRTKVQEYQDLRREIEELVGHINGLHSTVGHTPVQFLFTSVSEARLSALYQLADVCMVTPIRDGMNLVCQEFVASRRDDDGVLILSEFAGAARGLDGALQVNPWDREQMAEVLRRALEMPDDEKRSRMRRMKGVVRTRTVDSWARNFIGQLSLRSEASFDVSATSRNALESVDALVESFSAGHDRYILLDYDGTLRPFAPTPDEARPTAETLDVLRHVTSLPRSRVYIVSGRPAQTLEEWVGEVPAGLCAEHGLYLREAGAENWDLLVDINCDWMEFVLPILHSFAQNTPGALVEIKTAAVAWHWRRCEPDFGQWQANELALHLNQELANLPVEVIHGHRVIEVRAQGVHKGNLASHLSARWSPEDFILAVGDDETDEDLFMRLPEHAWSIRVGRQSANARYLLETQAQVPQLLRMLTESPVGTR
jgi:trehalose 6-phosphate synthase/phosphatase